MDEFVKELIGLCEKHKIKYDPMIPVETTYIETKEEVCSDTRHFLSVSASPMPTYIRYMLKAHTLKIEFKKLERSRL